MLLQLDATQSHTRTISSSVSSSIYARRTITPFPGCRQKFQRKATEFEPTSTVVSVSSTSPRTMLRCVSYAYKSWAMILKIRSTNICTVSRLCGFACGPVNKVHSSYLLCPWCTLLNTCALNQYRRIRPTRTLRLPLSLNRLPQPHLYGLASYAERKLSKELMYNLL